MAAGDVTDNNDHDYQDIRDDRIYTYLPLKRKQKKEFKFIINAAYLGRFYLPAIKFEAMYDNRLFANTKGQWIEIVKQTLSTE